MKPENLIFDSNGYLKLSDFDIAHRWDEETQNHNETSGTPWYMAPEVMQGSNHGPSADYFALGVITYECMFGQHPF